MNKNVQRFRAGELVEVPIPDPQGKWVRWSDYEQLQSKLAQVEQERNELRDQLRSEQALDGLTDRTLKPEVHEAIKKYQGEM